jgi:hypothetical protein
VSKKLTTAPNPIVSQVGVAFRAIAALMRTTVNTSVAKMIGTSSATSIETPPLAETRC